MKELTDSIKELVKNTFDEFEDESTEFLIQVASERVSSELNIDMFDANDIVMKCLYNNGEQW